MNYQETLDYLYSCLPMYQRIGKTAFKKDLDNTFKLCEKLGDPQTKFRSVHIAGTNGKGSTAHSLAAILQCAGYKTGLYTSPHLKSFTERIKINGKEISQQEVVEFVENIKATIEIIQPSFFEMTVAMAFDHFSRHQVDIAIIEVGLGGRLDSTNVITPELSLITNISKDHTDMLGNTLQAIAEEKAGIIKEGIPVVIGEHNELTAPVFLHHAQSLTAPLFFAENEYSARENDKKEYSEPSLNFFKNEDNFLSDVKVNLKGNYQAKNLPAILKAIELLGDIGYSTTKDHIKEGLENTVKITGLKGRWQCLQEEPKIICDIGHNEAGVRSIMEQLAQIDYKTLHIVWGMVNDKKIDTILSLLPEHAHYYFCQAQVPRALDAKILAAQAKQFGLGGEIIHNVNIALERAKVCAKEGDVIFVGGSTFVVAEVDDL
ncbi:folylpolyglutamate synthase/dihydrofolate synthase family protein [Fulvivirgaceae bacterium BMA10]|uniref:Dihydrofolate synthase/folylpolyglutamate synthase n=1 Tax=Splendidivirga corallicola TaxID=3051826 RepID=A0ABT8KQR5_9BACT|nr:folylpolyglutamate synthase/dihydrofolate synthase family protein [Fulvivirgaceae bacterium BMA10]